MRETIRGYTLIEMLVYGTILMIFMTVMTMIFSTLIEMQLSSESSASVAQDGRYLFSRLAYDIHRAGAIVTPAAIGGQSSVLELTINGQTYHYAVTDGNLMLTTPNGSAQLNSIGTTVPDLLFRRYGSDETKHSISVSFTLESTTSNIVKKETRDFQTTITLR